jgi:hypothetical protein
MVASPTGLGPENECAGEDQQQLQMTDPSQGARRQDELIGVYRQS